MKTCDSPSHSAEAVCSFENQLTQSELCLRYLRGDVHNLNPQMFICNFSQLSTSSCANKLCINKSSGYGPRERSGEWQVGLQGQHSPVMKLALFV